MPAVMSMATQTIDSHPRLIVALMASALVFFAVSCTFNDAIPICHYLFHCDHWFHSGESVRAVTGAPELLCHV